MEVFSIIFFKLHKSKKTTKENFVNKFEIFWECLLQKSSQT